MDTVIIVVHLMVVIALIAVVLMQRSEGGALGIGGSSNFLTSRGQGNILTKATAILAAAFFATSITMTVLSRFQATPSSILDTVPTGPATLPTPTTPAPATGETGGNAPGILDELPQSPATGTDSGSGGADSSATTPAPTTPAAPAEAPAPSPQ